MTEKRVLSFQPESGFYHKRAIKSIDKADFTAALKNLRKAVEMEPDNLTYKMDLADTYARMGLYERSNLELQLMLHRKEMPSEALFGMASNYMALGDYDQAENLYRTYEKVEPDGEFVPQADDALAYIAQCDYDTPLDRELDELSMDGKAALDAGDIGHAIDCLQKALEKDPTMLYVRNNLAVAYYCLGDMDKAWEQLDQVLDTDPMDVHGRCNESMFLLADGQKEEAAQAVRKLRLEQIEEIDELFKYCLALADVDLDEELAQALKKMFLSCPYDISMLFLWGACLYNLGRYPESVRAFEKVLLIDPDSLMAAWGFKLASAAVRDGTPPQNRIPYTYDLTDEMNGEVEAQMEQLTRMTPEQVREALNDEHVRLLLHAALMGTDQQVSQAVLLLGYGGGSVAERLLREVLLSPTHNMLIKQMTLEALHTMRASEPFYALRDGKLVLLRTKPIDVTGAMPESYLRVLRQAVERVGKNCTGHEQEAAEFVIGLWMGYLLHVEEGKPSRITKEAGWAAALEGAFRESRGEEVDWEALAQESGIALRTMEARRKELREAKKILDEENGQSNQ